MLRDPQSARVEMVRRSLARLGVGGTPPALAAEIAHRYCELRDGRMALVDGAVALLERLRAAGASLALVTNGGARSQRPKIDRFDLARHFDHIQIEGEFGAGKPDASVYDAALGALGVKAADATFIGDDLECDVRGPLRAGMQAVWIDITSDGLPTGHAARPRRIIRSVADLHDEL
ncbi:MAG: HAD-IA family hydrolase [Dehalococcoidia bacterium]